MRLNPLNIIFAEYKFLNDIPISKKLRLLLAIFVVSFITLLAVSTYYLNAVKVGGKLYASIKTYNDGSATLIALNSNLVEIRYIMTCMLIDNDADKIKTLTAELQESVKKYDESFKKVAATSLDPDLKQAISDIQTSWDEMKTKINERFIKMIESGNSAAKNYLMIGALNQLYRRLDGQLSSTDSVFKIKIANYEKQVAGEVTRGIAVNAGFGILMLFIVILLVQKTAGSITMPLKKIMDSMSDIIAGKLDNTDGADTTRRDELGLLASSFRLIADTVRKIIGEVGRLSDAAARGDLLERGDSSSFSGAYAELIAGFNKTLDSVSAPVSEVAGVLQRLEKNDNRSGIEGEFPGMWSDIKNAVNGLRSRLIGVTAVAVNISNGNTSDIVELQKTGKLSDADELTPAFIRMIEAIKRMITDIDSLATAAIEGRMNARADASAHNGDFSKLIGSINGMLEEISRPVNEVVACLERMAEGDLTVSVKGDYRGDHAKTRDALNKTIDSINDILNHVLISVDQVNTGARQVSDASQSLSQAATEQASSLEEISATMHEIGSQSRHNAENAGQAAKLAAEAKAEAENGNAKMLEMDRAMNAINESAAGVAKIIKAIDEIAFQTNLLALNAAVEAARAGKHGKGFTVVAEEVRNLAQRSARAAKETAEMIENSIKKTETGTKIARDTIKALDLIVGGATKVTDLIGEIASSSKEQEHGINQVNTGLGQVDQVTQQNTATAEEAAAASEELSSQALELRHMLTRFRLRAAGAAATGHAAKEIGFEY